MKKVISLVLCAVLISAAAGCGKESNPPEKSTDGGSILVAYFSHTGNTKKLAEMIAEKTGGELFEIETVIPYPEDYDACVETAAKEREDNARPELLTQVEDMDKYNEIYLGFPIWWGTMPMAVFTFIEEYDFTGKTVIPFCTHGGSGLGRSGKDLAEICGDAVVLEGFAAAGQDVDNVGEDMAKWLEE